MDNVQSLNSTEEEYYLPDQSIEIIKKMFNDIIFKNDIKQYAYITSGHSGPINYLVNTQDSLKRLNGPLQASEEGYYLSPNTFLKINNGKRQKKYINGLNNLVYDLDFHFLKELSLTERKRYEELAQILIKGILEDEKLKEIISYCEWSGTGFHIVISVKNTYIVPMVNNPTGPIWFPKYENKVNLHIACIDAITDHMAKIIDKTINSAPEALQGDLKRLRDDNGKYFGCFDKKVAHNLCCLYRIPLSRPGNYLIYEKEANDFKHSISFIKELFDVKFEKKEAVIKEYKAPDPKEDHEKQLFAKAIDYFEKNATKKSIININDKEIIDILNMYPDNNVFNLNKNKKLIDKYINMTKEMAQQPNIKGYRNSLIFFLIINLRLLNKRNKTIAQEVNNLNDSMGENKLNDQELKATVLKACNQIYSQDKAYFYVWKYSTVINWFEGLLTEQQINNDLTKTVDKRKEKTNMNKLEREKRNQEVAIKAIQNPTLTYNELGILFGMSKRNVINILKSQGVERAYGRKVGTKILNK